MDASVETPEPESTDLDRYHQAQEMVREARAKLDGVLIKGVAASRVLSWRPVNRRQKRHRAALVKRLRKRLGHELVDFGLQDART